MVCYICGKPASLCCKDCGRYVCSDHMRRLGAEYFVCLDCYESHLRERKEEERKKYHQTHYCYIHECFHDDEYLQNDKWESKLGIVRCYCAIKQFCADSAILGNTKELKDWDTGIDNYADAVTVRLNFLCPVCNKPVFNYDKVYDRGKGFLDSIRGKLYYNSLHSR